MLKLARVGTVLLLVAGLCSPAMAGEWTAVKLRGIVMGLFDGEWIELRRGDVVPEDQPIRTLASGRVTFVRGGETIDLGPNTQVQIIDRAGQAKYTTVKQYFGQVTVEAEARQVKHFEVQTPYLAAVVKGTRFVVTTDDEGAKVRVERGAVAVEDMSSHDSVQIVAGQQVTASSEAVMQVSGGGELPQVRRADGTPVSNDDDDASGNSAFGQSNGNGGNAGGNGGNSGNGGDGANSGGGNGGNGGDGGDGANSGNGNGGGNGGGDNANSGGGNGGGNGGDGANSGNGNGGGNSQGNAGNGGGSKKDKD